MGSGPPHFSYIHNTCAHQHRGTDPEKDVPTLTAYLPSGKGRRVDMCAASCSSAGQRWLWLTLTPFTTHAAARSSGTSAVIMPGGGYKFLSVVSENTSKEIKPCLCVPCYYVSSRHTPFTTPKPNVPEPRTGEGGRGLRGVALQGGRGGGVHSQVPTRVRRVR